MWEERRLRRVTQAEHGEAAVAGDEPDGEHAAVASLESLGRVDKRPAQEPGNWQFAGLGGAFLAPLG
jgi:hypothetical protein